jgi:hypothetical protein
MIYRNVALVATVMTIVAKDIVDAVSLLTVAKRIILMRVIKIIKKRTTTTRTTTDVVVTVVIVFVTAMRMGESVVMDAVAAVETT